MNLGAYVKVDMSQVPKIAVIKFSFKQEWRTLGEALRVKDPYDSETVSSASELLAVIQKNKGALVIANLKDREDFVQLATFAKQSKKAVKDCAFKLVVVNFSYNKQYEKAVGKLGILDIVDPTVNTKALRFKIDFWMKSLRGQMKTMVDEVRAVKTLAKKEETQGPSGPSVESINWSQPVECEDDVWLLKKEVDCKKLMGKWAIKLMGPSPYVAQWTDVKPRVWRFDFRPENKEDFITQGGAWYFTGDQKPEFVWKENLWFMSGQSFELIYKCSAGLFSRVKVKDRIIVVATNSDYAKFKEQLIIQSFDKEMVFKKEAEILDDKNDVDGDGNPFLENLEGKGKTDHMTGDPLSGDVESTDKVNRGHMTLDLEDGDQNIDREGLEGKIGHSREETNWEGQNSSTADAGEDFDGPAADPFSSGQELGLTNKNQKHETKYRGHNEAEEFEAGELGKGLSVKASKHRDGGLLDMENTHHEHETKYRGHNEAEEYEAGELGGKSQYREEEHGPNGGKSSTDRLSKFYNKDPEFDGESLEDSEDGGYSGHSSTDKLKKHYGLEEDADVDELTKKRQARAHAKRSGQSAENEFSEDGQESYEGDSETEKLASHYGSRKSAGEDGSKGTMGGKSGTDRLPSHLTKPRDEFLEDESEEEIDSEQDPGSLRARADRGTEKSTRTSPQREGHGTGARGALDGLDEENYGGAGHTDHLAGHYGGKKAHNPLEKKEAKSHPELYKRDRKESANGSADDALDEDKSSSEGFGSETFDDGGIDDHGFDEADVVSLEEVRQNRSKVSEEGRQQEKSLAQLTADAKVTCVLSQGYLKVTCVLDDFFENVVIFRAPHCSFKSSEKVSLDLTFSYMKKNTNLSFQGDLQSVDKDDEGMNYVSIIIHPDSAAAFEKFMSLYQSRQMNVSEFLKKARGL